MNAEPSDIEEAWELAKKNRGYRESEREIWERSRAQAIEELGPSERKWQEFLIRDRARVKAEDDFKTDVLTRLDNLETGAMIPSPNSKRSYLVLIRALAEISNLNMEKPYAAESAISAHLEKRGNKLSREFIGRTLKEAREQD